MTPLSVWKRTAGDVLRVLAPTRTCPSCQEKYRPMHQRQVHCRPSCRAPRRSLELFDVLVTT